jgi:hypothetical protein
MPTLSALPTKHAPLLLSALLLPLILPLFLPLPSALAAPDSTTEAALAGKIGQTRPELVRLLADISPARIEQHIRQLVSFHTRHTASDTESASTGIGAARRAIKAELERCGAGQLTVRFDSHIEPAGPRLAEPTEIVNVVATLPGRMAGQAGRERIYVVSGHYDSRASDVNDATSFAPGANDDASGTAAVIEMACVTAKARAQGSLPPFDATLVFMAVAGEEQGLFGAAHYAKRAREQGQNIAGMLTNDIIGSSRADDGRIDASQVRLFAEGIAAKAELPEAQRKLLASGGESDSATRQLARHVKEVGERYLPGFGVTLIHRRDRYLRGGDHIPFLEQGYPALRLTEPNEDFRHQHQDVRLEHGVQLGDLPEFVDFDYVAKVARVNLAALVTLAMAPAAPVGVKMHTEQLENDTRLSWQASPEPDLAAYRIVWRDTTASVWQGSVLVGKVTDYRIKGKSKDNYLFGVQAVNRDGYVSVASYPLP